MSNYIDKIQVKFKEVEEKEAELCLAHLRFLLKFYITIIENKQSQMNMALAQYLANRDDRDAYIEWTGSKVKIADLYQFWLRELLNITMVDDIRAICMHQMMATDCYWFLAKIRKPAFHSGRSNYEMACRCMAKILHALIDLLPERNAFLFYLIQKYSLLLLDYHKAIELRSPHSSHTNERDTELCRSHIFGCRNFIEKIIENKKAAGLDNEPCRDLTTEMQEILRF